MALALLMLALSRPRRYHPRTELDDWIDLAFFVFGVVALIGAIAGGIGAFRARRRA